MRDKHFHIAADSQLLKTIYRQVEEQLVMNRKAARRLIRLKLLLYLPLAACCYAALYFVHTPALFICCYMAYGMMAVLLAFNFSHDCAHNTVFKSKYANHLCFTLLYTLTGAHAEAWKQRHIYEHHYAPNVADYDPDLKISGLIRVLPGSRRRWYHRFQHWYAPLGYTLYSLFWIFVKDMLLLYSGRRSVRYHLSFWLQKTGYITYLLVLPLLFSAPPWYVVLGGFIGMHFLQSLFLLFTFLITHHVEATDYPDTNGDGYIKTSWLMNQVKSSNDMHPFSSTANFILGGFNNHIAHHLFPHVHHVHYPCISRILYAILEAHGIMPNHTSYFGGIRSHLRLLKRMGRPV